MSVDHSLYYTVILFVLKGIYNHCYYQLIVCAVDLEIRDPVGRQ